MHDKDLDRLLFEAVAEALGVDARRTPTPRPREPLAPQQAST